MSLVLGPWAGKIVAIAILVSTFSATNSVILTAPRVFYAMANDNLFFKKLAQVHPHFQTPAWAIIALGVWSAILSCAGKIRRAGFWRNFYRMDFLRTWSRGNFSHPPSLKRFANSLPRARLSMDTTDLRNCRRGDRWQCCFSGLRRSSQFRYLAVAIVIFLLGLPAYYFWRRKQSPA